jgi:hypothetical protein
MAEFTNEHVDLLNAIYNLAHQIEQTKDPAKIAGYVDELSKLKAKLMGPPAAKKTPGHS